MFRVKQIGGIGVGQYRVIRAGRQIITVIRRHGLRDEALQQGIPIEEKVLFRRRTPWQIGRSGGRVVERYL